MLIHRATRIGLSVLALAIVLAGLTAALHARGPRDETTLPAWLTIHGEAVTGLTRSEARERLQALAEREGSRTFIVILSQPDKPRRMWTFRRTALGAAVDVEAMLDKAFQTVDAERPWDRVNRWLGRGENVDIPIVWRVDQAVLEKTLRTQVARVVDRPPINARLVMSQGKLSVRPDASGLAVDIPRSVALVAEALAQHDSDRAEIVASVVPAKVTAAQAATIRHQLAVFSTHYKERGNRKRNLEVACERINGTVIGPGEVFSYNAVVGPRDARNGFALAPVIVRGRMEPGMGGGVCQVSSTLYNAALLAGLQIVARRPHGFPVHYVPSGQDATVVYGYIDLKVKNSGDGPIAFFADAQRNKVTVRVYGTSKLPYTVSLERTGISSWPPQTKTVADAGLPAGTRLVRDKGRSGHKVTVWRVYRQNGRVIRRELVSRDTYSSFPRVVVVGAGPQVSHKPPSGAANGDIINVKPVVQTP